MLEYNFNLVWNKILKKKGGNRFNELLGILLFFYILTKTGLKKVMIIKLQYKICMCNVRKNLTKYDFLSLLFFLSKCVVWWLW